MRLRGAIDVVLFGAFVTGALVLGSGEAFGWRWPVAVVAAGGMVGVWAIVTWADRLHR
jgi:hypothetical protein